MVGEPKILTREQQRIKLREQLKRELFQADKAKHTAKKRAHKSEKRLCKRARFLQNPNNLKDPKEKREKTEAWFKKK